MDFYSCSGGGVSVQSELNRRVEDWGIRTETSPVRSSFNGATPLTNHATNEVMMDFMMNGIDTPYEPDEDQNWDARFTGTPVLPPVAPLSGMGPAKGIVRQKSWPAPEATPSKPLNQPSASGTRGCEGYIWKPAPTAQMAWNEGGALTSPFKGVTPEQIRVLQTLPSWLVHALLQELEGTFGREREMPMVECGFCKKNGERASFYRSHRLHDAGGRVTCPVLGALVCRRCGATGPAAHTIKYCPEATDRERQMSSLIVRSMRMASGRKRNWPEPAKAPHAPHPSPQNQHDQGADHIWFALERKLRI